MIFYFSATGNNKYVAQRIGEATGDRLVSITECMRDGKFDYTLLDKEALGFVMPTYFWGLPTIVTDFMEKLTLKHGAQLYTYHVLTFGSTTGSAHRDMERLLRDKGIALQARFAVRMVDTWTPMFDLSDPEKNRRDTENAEPEIEDVIEKIKLAAVGDFDSHKGPALIAKLVHREYEQKRATKYFKVKSDCLNCGHCAKSCPMQAIEMQNGHPVWLKEKCTLCLGCLHRCPRFAIQYGDKTEKHGQFVNPNVRM